MPNIEGQGIAWDRSADGRIMYGIRRPDRHVIVTALPGLEDVDTTQPVGVVRIGTDMR